MASYYLHRDGENFGPYESEDFFNYLQQGQIQPNDLVCPVGDNEWVPASSIARPLSSSVAIPQQPTAQQPTVAASPFLTSGAAPVAHSHASTSRHSFPTSLKVAAWFIMIPSIFTILIALAFFTFPLLGLDPSISSTDTIFTSIISILILAYGLFGAYAGSSLLKRKKKGRNYCIIIAAIGCLSLNLLSITALILCLTQESKDYFANK